MSEAHGPGRRWVKACAGGACVEARRTVAGDVLLRNSQRPDAMLRFTRDEWYDFIWGVERGEFA